MDHKHLPGQVVFIGHGSPVNILEDNAYTRALRQWALSRPQPEVILVISAHWLTQRTFVSCQADPKQIFDFYGFPDALYHVPYPCSGHPVLAQEVIQHLSAFSVHCFTGWGIDHAAWSVLKHMYPQAQIPVVELSLDMTKPPEYHYQLGQALKPLRHKNCLILASGNLVHNLRLLSWTEQALVPDWAQSMDAEIKQALLASDHSSLLAYPANGSFAQLGIPTTDHYLPLLYVLGLQESTDRINFIFEGFQNGTISMRAFELVNS